MAHSDFNSQSALIQDVSAALDEVYRLRQCAAHAAMKLESVMGYSTMPKAVREELERQILDLQRISRGEAKEVRSSYKYSAFSQAMLQSGMNPLLTRHQFREWHMAMRKDREAI